MLKKRSKNLFISMALVIVLVLSFNVCAFAASQVGGYNTSISNSWSTPGYSISSGTLSINNSYTVGISSTQYNYMDIELLKYDSSTGSYNIVYNTAKQVSGTPGSSYNKKISWTGLSSGKYKVHFFFTTGIKITKAWYISGYIYDGSI